VHLIQNTCLNHTYCLPNKLFEYMLAGIPVIISDLPEIAEVVREYDTGITVDPEDEDAIARAIRQMAEDDDLRRHYAQSALRAALVLNWEQEKARLSEVYRQIADMADGADASVGRWRG
jgi:glycosyltransferase involved in cell wall biosynthesis